MVNYLQKNLNKRGDVVPNNQLNGNSQSDKLQADQKIREKVLERYKDIEGTSLKQMNVGLWLLEHKNLFRKTLYTILISISVITWSMFIYTFGYYIFFGMQADQRMLAELSNPSIAGHDYVSSISAEDIKLSEIQALKNSSGSYDFVAKATNLNEDHYALFTYHFESSGQLSEKADGFILPAESKYIVQLGQKISASTASAKLVIDKIEWNRINKHEYPDWQMFKNDHINFPITEMEFVPARTSELSEKLYLNELNFKIKNQTPYNYLKLPLNIVIFSSTGQKVAAERLVIDKFYSGQEKDTSLTVIGNFGSVTDVEISADINILLPNIYFEFEGQSDYSY